MIDLTAKRAELAGDRARLDAQIELLDELLGAVRVEVESGLARRLDPPKRPAEKPVPKAVRPDPAPKPAGKVAAGYAERVADALLGGPLATPAIEGKAGISYPTVQKALKGRPDWFLRTGAGISTRWELTQEGRQAAQSRQEDAA